MANEDPPKPADLPPYPDMILGAIESLDDKSGASKSAISAYIEEKYEDLPSAHASLLTANLASMKESGKLVFAKNNYLRADNPEAPPKRGRGRPRKDPNASAPTKVATAGPKRGPGRPPKSKGRGRPPKAKDPEAEALADAVAQATSGMPRPRGRPPKIAKITPAEDATPADEAPPAEVTSAPAPSSGSADAPPAKRGRGRPPKVKP